MLTKNLQRRLMKRKNNAAAWTVGLCGVLLSACQPVSTEVTAPAIIDPESAGAKVLVAYCSDCHAPPRPASHVADEWPGVVYRMQEERRMTGYPLMKDDDMDILVAYLQQHAGN